MRSEIEQEALEDAVEALQARVAELETLQTTILAAFLATIKDEYSSVETWAIQAGGFAERQGLDRVVALLEAGEKEQGE